MNNWWSHCVWFLMGWSWQSDSRLKPTVKNMERTKTVHAHSFLRVSPKSPYHTHTPSGIRTHGFPLCFASTYSHVDTMKTRVLRYASCVVAHCDRQTACASQPVKRGATLFQPLSDCETYYADKSAGLVRMGTIPLQLLSVRIDASVADLL